MTWRGSCFRVKRTWVWGPVGIKKKYNGREMGLHVHLDECSGPAEAAGPALRGRCVWWKVHGGGEVVPGLSPAASSLASSPSALPFILSSLQFSLPWMLLFPTSSHKSSSLFFITCICKYHAFRKAFITIL